MEKSNDSNLHVRWEILNFSGEVKLFIVLLQGLELHAMCFVFKTAVVFLCKERLRQKKKSLIVRILLKYYIASRNENIFATGILQQVLRS